MDINNIAGSIRQHRKIKGLTQEELAQKTGLSTMSIRRYERAERIVSEKNLKKIAEVLSIDIQDLLDGPGISIADDEVDTLRDELKALRFSLGKIGLKKAIEYIKFLMQSPENRPEEAQE